MVQNNTVPIVVTATAIPLTKCIPPPDAEVSVTGITVGITSPPLGEFSYSWAGPGGSSFITQNVPVTTPGEYMVTATKSTTTAFGCSSAPFRVVVRDLRRTPTVLFTTVNSSSCDNEYDGRITVTATTTIIGTDPDPGAGSNYNFEWTNDPDGSGTAYRASAPANNTVSTFTTLHTDRIGPGSYSIKATNFSTGCIGNGSVNIGQTTIPMSITSVTSTPITDCKPTTTGTGTVVSISGPSTLLTDYTYTWDDEPSFALPNLVALLPTEVTLTGLRAGTYYIKAKRNEVINPATPGVSASGCSTDAVSFRVMDTHVSPVVGITQTLKQVMCNATGSASLSVTGDGQTDANPNYAFRWFNNLANTAPSFATTSTVNNLVHGNYSVTVLDSRTNCDATALYIVTDDSGEFRPIVSAGGQPRSLCVGQDGSVTARVVNYAIPATPPDANYPFLAYTADSFTATARLTGSSDVLNMSGNNGFTDFVHKGLAEGAYVVRITDTKTGCFGEVTHQVGDARIYPVPSIATVARVTNCDPLRPNGVARATSNGTFIGFRFDWYEGATVTGTNKIYEGSEFNELKASPQQYIVRATNVINGCTNDVTTSLESEMVNPLLPEIEKLSDVTSCAPLPPNGKLSVSVGPDKNTRDYVFLWYDGTTEGNRKDFEGEIYSDLGVGSYSVTAINKLTGCKSPLATEKVDIDQLFPDFDFDIRNSTCDKNDGFATLKISVNAPIERIEWIKKTDATIFALGPNLTDASAGSYKVTATTFLGCVTEKDVTIIPDIRAFNGISKNQDGLNEIFTIDCIQNFPNNLVQVFNRAGTLVYEGNGYD
ncbi:MAG: gliding motility-associated C-terminal domain-containing protein, partial [Cyclobacteriaceae bacterium]|nr:gliding motility-associated C-terminal domain-containing protein [Cyclobacteriaceae bacterium]